MTRENAILLVIVLALATLVAGLHVTRGTRPGEVYYKLKSDGTPQTLSAADAREELARRASASVTTPISAGAPATTTHPAEPPAMADVATAQPAAPGASLHWSGWRTLGLWIAGFLTLAILSLLYKDNPFYRVAESLYVGIAAAYYMVSGFWAAIAPVALAELFPRAMKLTVLPAINLDRALLENQTSRFAGLIDYDAAGDDGIRAAWWQLMDPLFWIPVALAVMLLMRLAPRGHWMARWPLAFLIGMTAGVRMLGYLEADFVRQIDASLLPLWAPVYEESGGRLTLSLSKTIYASTSNMIIVFGMLCALLYFFFSIEHKGLVGRASRAGVYVLMITFGAGFGYTVMGRIALLSERFKFILGDWLNLL